MIMRRGLLLLTILLLWAAPALAQTWPDPNAFWVIRLHKTAGMEMTDPYWAHLHLNSAEASSVTVSVETISHVSQATLYPGTDVTQYQLQLRYTVHGIAVSGWLNTPPYTFTLDFANSALGSITDGVHDLSVEVQGLAGAGTPGGQPTIPVKQDFRPYPMYLHIGGRSTPSTLVPVIAQNDRDFRVEAANYSGYYIDASTLTPTGHPASSDVGAGWSGAPPYTEDLYQEAMQPHSREFSGIQMLWEEPPGTVNAGLKFLRNFGPKFGNSYTRLWDNGGTDPTAFGFSGHRSFPVKDGPRGVGWTNGYVQGVVDADGILWMVNISGQLRIMKPDGELITVVGWRVRTDKEPVWYLKPLTSIRTNMEFRGTFTSGGWPDALEPGWHQPMDVALDPNDNTKVYVTAFYDNAVYQVDVNRTTWTGTVSILAGDINHMPGYVNATGDQARFWHPVSAVTNAAGTILYVTDHDNDTIRAINLSTHAVTTAFGDPLIGNQLQAAGVTCYNDDAVGSGGTRVRLACVPPSQTKPHLHVTVTPTEATAGIRPDIYYPFWIRLTSTDELVLFDRALNTIRKITPSTGVTTLIDSIEDAGFGPGEFARGWVWGDVDKTGNAGLVDGIYWGTDVSNWMPSQETVDRFNEEYRFTSIDGSVHKFVFGRSYIGDPEGIGPVDRTLPPHYPWLMAVDPRGAVIFGGIGDHGLTRLRVRKDTDPTIPDNLVHYDARKIWESGAPSPLGSFYTLTPNVTNSLVNAPALLYGWGGHNMIGVADTWSITPTTADATIDSMFSLSSAITSNATAHAAVLAFLRQFSEGTTAPPTPDVTAPSVSVTAPAAGTISGTVTVTASASDNVGVVGVQFLLDGLNLQAEDTSSPFSISWDTTQAVPNGAHTLKARARDLAGNVTTSAGVSVTVTNTVVDVTAPAVSITAPAAGNVNGTVSVTATATDNVAVVGVQFKLDGQLLSAEDTSSPYAISWDTTGTTNGAHTLTALARDAAGNTTASAGVAVTVNNASADVTPPTVSITTGTATVSGTTTIAATAADAVGVVGVQFKIDGAALNPEDTSAPYSIQWDTTQVANATYTLTALARDAAGNTTTSAGVSFTVNNTAPPPPPPDTTLPTVAFTSPANGAILTSGAATTLSVSASDNVSVSSVLFYVDGEPINTADTVAPYSTVWTAVVGAHTLSARALDPTGNAGVATIAVTVSAPPAAGAMTMTTSATTVVVGQSYTLTIDTDPRTVHLVRLNNQRVFTGHDCTPTACHKVIVRKTRRVGTITERLTGEKDDLSQWPPVVITITVIAQPPEPRP